MNAIGWLQLVFYVVVLLAITKPIGLYLVRVLDPAGKTFLDPVVKPIERLFYWLFRVDPRKEQNWKQYASAMLIFSLVSMLFTYGILRLQSHLPWYGNIDPLTNKTAMTPDLGMNTAASFTTNTNWQSYPGETTMTYFSQMVALASHNFWSAAVGIAIAAAFVRGIARDKSGVIGNFWADLVRLNLYLLLPICIVYAVVLVSQGMIQNFSSYQQLNMLDQSGASNGQAVTQTIPMGPMASQVAIKMLGTNGGGFTNANAAHPYENPTPLSNFLQMLSIFAIPSGLTYYLGRTVKSQAHGWAVWTAMFILFMVGALVCWSAESAGNPRMTQVGVSASDGNMEGKEVRFGIFSSALFATITTDASCGAVNAMHDSFTPLGGLVPLFNIHLGEVVFGGVGAGLYGMLVFVVIAIFIAGLMVGRTPEYLGKKIEAYDIKVASLSILILSVIILGFTAWACVSPWGAAGLNNSGPHGFSEMHYAYTSGAGNNGSAFAGLTTNTPWWNNTLTCDMLLGRFFMIIPILALAGNLASKRKIPIGAGTFPVTGGTFVLLLIGTVIIVGALTFLPALSLGPIVEHFLMRGSGPLY
ncbi:MAG: potassium-transporting ATPase subunit KdpA [Planctomycetota bacterium]|nr:potassium-transporting ATPase subunit KdpA [Planctomycetota bacterium]